MSILTLREYFGGFEKEPELTDEMRRSAGVIVAKASELLNRAGIITSGITSGFRPKSYNKQIGGSITSKHCYCQAVDLWDPDKALGAWCMQNLEALIEIGLWMESLTKTHESEEETKRWVHVQTVAPGSGNRVFIP